MKLPKWLLYLTNNEAHSRHEEILDVIFFIAITISLIIGIYVLLEYSEPQWIAFLAIEYIWAFDNLRHNR